MPLMRFECDQAKEVYHCNKSPRKKNLRRDGSMCNVNKKIHIKSQCQHYVKILLADQYD